jgi:hypothetical protein
MQYPIFCPGVNSRPTVSCLPVASIASTVPSLLSVDITYGLRALTLLSSCSDHGLCSILFFVRAWIVC